MYKGRFSKRKPNFNGNEVPLLLCSNEYLQNDEIVIQDRLLDGSKMPGKGLFQAWKFPRLQIFLQEKYPSRLCTKCVLATNAKHGEQIHLFLVSSFGHKLTSQIEKLQS